MRARTVKTRGTTGRDAAAVGYRVPVRGAQNGLFDRERGSALRGRLSDRGSWLRARGKRLFGVPAVIVLLGAVLVACAPPGISVHFAKTPANGTTTVTVSVTGSMVLQTTVRVDTSTSAPVATSSAASFSFDLDTTTLTNTAHTLLVSSADRDRVDLGSVPVHR